MIRHAEAVQDCALPGSPVLAEVEAAYRRGYQQGAYVAVDAIRRGVPLSRVHRWATEALHRWRYADQPWKRGRIVKARRPPDPDPAPKPSRN